MDGVLPALSSEGQSCLSALLGAQVLQPREDAGPTHLCGEMAHFHPFSLEMHGRRGDGGFKQVSGGEACALLLPGFVLPLPMNPLAQRERSRAART